ncbi:MAG: GreA/GreB family elongation factor [Flavobacteriales bacterium]|jgi:regulator of nucleoside diphosphate kinase|nr:GreA/GreB family elongation factor [Flavobacteriales bacterium]MBP6642112.1 GreA/GreB family elongation factor [Flavobacteriales bacterium]MBP7156297.1 GreA/GreB family elongation factor [Flavobacteriales bacterium]HQV75765.1 GreA/GreB family elongation factor [Flavobacteriales bacterium]HQW41575.1 GreA/GreB family elongation factor [Flavobacteriales bacterium]
MENPRLVISAKERELIMAWIIGSTPADVSIRDSLDKLYTELEQAEIRAEYELPKDVVRVNSIVTIQSPSGRKEGLQVVMPLEADLKANKLSVFTVMGSALVGYREGTTINWKLPKGEETIYLEKVDNSKVKNEVSSTRN